MTLVVARVVPEGCFLIGDLKISDPNAVTSSPLGGALKLIILDKDTCIAFAGSIGFGQYAARTVLQEYLRGTKLVDYLLGEHIESRRSVDFIVATLKPHPSLTRITAGVMESNLEAAWIGDAHAYTVYQVHYHHRPFAKLNDEFKMTWAFEQVMQDPGILSVDRPSIAVQTFRGDFRYAQTITAHPPPNARTILDLGDAASGGYTSSVWAPLETGIGAVGIHFYQGNLGVLYYPKMSHEPFVFPNVTQEQFRQAVYRRFDLQIEGGRIDKVGE